MRYVVGIDGGGTKTTAAVVGDDGKLVASATSGPRIVALWGWSPPAPMSRGGDGGDQRKRASPSTGCQACAWASPASAPIWASPSHNARSASSTYTGRRSLNDVVGAWAGATAVSPGIVVIAGTARAALGMNRRGEFWRTDGWDTLLGDQGSGYALGLAAIRMVMRMLDGRFTPSPLAHALTQAFGVQSAEDMRRSWIAPRLGSMRWPLARYVSETAQAGDPVAAISCVNQARRSPRMSPRLYAFWR